MKPLSKGLSSWQGPREVPPPLAAGLPPIMSARLRPHGELPRDKGLPGPCLNCAPLHCRTKWGDPRREAGMRGLCHVHRGAPQKGGTGPPHWQAQPQCQHSGPVQVSGAISLRK